MRSIRLSLIVYFLILLGLGLGSVSVLAYQTTQQSLQAKEKRLEGLLRGEHDRRCDAEREKLDNRLLRKVRELENVTNRPFGRTPPARGPSRWPYYVGIVGAALNPRLPLFPVLGYAGAAEAPPNNPVKRVGNLTTVSWPLLRLHMELHPLSDLQSLSLLAAAQDPGSLLLCYGWVTPWSFARSWIEHTRPLSVWIEFPDGVFPGNREGPEAEFCEVFSESGAPWQRSHSLGDEQSLALDADAVETVRPAKWRIDNVQMPSGPHLRRITYRPRISPLLARHFAWFRPTGPWRGRPAGVLRVRQPREPGSPWGFGDGTGGTFFIVYAVDTAERDRNLAILDHGLQAQLDDQAAESRRVLADLSKHLLGIGLVTFALTLIGGYALVRLGLSPLHRLSEAVSRVSTRDFRLPLENRRVPAELSPIVERLEQTLAQLKRAFAREKQAAADISHELRTPLAALTTTVDVALRKPRSPEQYREALEDCRSSSKHMTQLVERLLALARLDAGVDTLRPREVDVTDLAQQCAALVRPLADARGLSLQVHAPELTRLKTDPDKLREVVTNLLHNAIQYNRPDGAIDLTVARENGHLRLEVRDTGIGIGPEAREHIFERFYRADPSRHADDLHAGLGLAIVKGYVDLMGGTIAVESAEGQGSTFRLCLPA